MRIIADLHIHSPYSRAVSRDMTLENLDEWAGFKGINVIGTGDFTHPAWIKNIKEKLEPAEPGLFKLKSRIRAHAYARFMLSVEISSIYSKDGRTRRVHSLVFVPSIASAEKVNMALGWRGNLKSDGRPILGLDAKELARIAFESDPDAVVVPAHAWTPWFSVFGSMSGFDSLEECYGELAPHIFAIETGLSSDPAMNWRCSFLDRIALLSNSDSHSLKRIGREANIFEADLSYNGIMDAVRSRDPARFLSTIEFFPEEGKYHYDGHRACKFSCAPEETAKLKGLCRVCEKPVTVGVMSRVNKLADRSPDVRPEGTVPFVHTIPLDEIIAESFSVGPASKKVRDEYQAIVGRIGSEIRALLDAPAAELAAATTPEVCEGILRVREGRVQITPGYDGEYGGVKIFRVGETATISPQSSLF